MDRQIHNITPADTYTFLHTSADGLEARQVTERLAEVGPNTIEIKRRYQTAKNLARQFTNFFSILLDLSALICFVADQIQPGEGMLILGWALLGVSILNALFSFVQEYRAERAMEELAKFLPQTVLGIRNGVEAEVMSEGLVPGDVIVLREGDKVPADARLVECEGLIVNNAPLTGESRPFELTAEAQEGRMNDSTNLLFAGCTVLRGSGTAVVFATARRTEFGKIATLSHEVKRKPSPLERETAHMVRVLTIIAVTMGLVFFVYGVVNERSLWVNLVFMMGIIVANVPEGLLPTFTLSLAMGSLRMAKRNVLVKSLNAVEAMGAIHVICTDKTGTLTQNRLAVSKVVDPLSGDALHGDQRYDLLRVALAASDVRSGENGLSGDPLDVAIAEVFVSNGGDFAAVEASRLRHFAFDTQKRRAAGLVREDGETLFCVKGAWESLQPLLDLSEQDSAKAEQVLADMASQGSRVVALASRRGVDSGSEQETYEQDLVLQGFLCSEDPIRTEVPAAVAECHTAHIRVIMITGDHPQTAEAIARQAGIVADDVAVGAATITGLELESLGKTGLMQRLEDGVNVFARTTPEQKWKIVEALHELDKVVAVTGDGVNDAPALKAADVGIAMGLGGTDVAREAAQVILLDDNFASIVHGIEEGRTIYGNIRKFTNYVLVSNGPEILPYLIYMLFPVPLALTVIQILAIDLGTDIIPSMALGQEKPDKDVMRQPPRDRKQGLLTLPLIAHSYGFLGLIEAVISLSLFFWVLVDGGWQWGQDLGVNDALYRSATGIALSSILLMQIGNLFGRRSRYESGLSWDAFKNKLLVIGLVFEITFSWAMLYFPPLGNILGTGPVDWQIYAIAWAGPVVIFTLDYARKRVAFRLSNRP